MHYPVLSHRTARRHLGAGLLCAAWGTAVAVPIFAAEPPSNALSLILAAAVGAGLAGILCAPFFGRMGRAGLALAVLGGLLCTVIGAGLGGILLLGPAAGPPAAAVIAEIILKTPLIAMLWACCLLTVHLGARWLRG
jgi:hypothetical protein